MIETERLLLRKPGLDDAGALHEAYSDPEVMRYIGLGGTFGREETRAWLEKALARWDANGFGHFVLERDGVVIGRAGGHGYAGEVAAACRDHAFGELGLTRLISLIAPGNERSVRVAEKLGTQYRRDVGRGDWHAQLYALERA